MAFRSAWKLWIREFLARILQRATSRHTRHGAHVTAHTSRRTTSRRATKQTANKKKCVKAATKAWLLENGTLFCDSVLKTPRRNPIKQARMSKKITSPTMWLLNMVAVIAETSAHTTTDLNKNELMYTC
jgi:hypothetical protein